MKQILFGLIVLFLLTACSTTKVHLFTQGVEAGELDGIAATLENQGFRVRLVELQPPELRNAAIIYSPAHPHIEDVENIGATLFELGYKDIDLIAVGRDNQSYTGRNVGLYLGEPSINQKVEQSGQHFPTEFAGHCHSTDAYLMLYTNGNFDLNIISWDESDKEHSNKMSGQWKERGDILEVFVDKFAATEFQIETFVRTDEHNLYKKTQLTSVDSSKQLAGCRFTSTLISSK